jgi:uncharacterized protein YndB with AHSA1/START domain
MPYTVSSSIVINRSPDEVFAAIADPQVQVTYDGETYRSAEKLTDGPIGKGTRFRGDFTGMGKVEYEYSEFEPGRLIQHRVMLPAGKVFHRFELSPEAGGTRLTQSIDTDPSLLGRILWSLVLEKKLRDRVKTLNARVRTFVESGSRAAANQVPS